MFQVQQFLHASQDRLNANKLPVYSSIAHNQSQNWQQSSVDPSMLLSSRPNLLNGFHVPANVDDWSVKPSSYVLDCPKNSPLSSFSQLGHHQLQSPLFLPIRGPANSSSEFEPKDNVRNTFWKGDFKRRTFVNPIIFSNKLFIGGIPPHMSEEEIVSLLRKFDNNLIIEWPDVKPNTKSTSSYLRVILSSNECIANLLNSCKLVMEGGCETFNYSILYKNKRKQLQVVPWLSSDSQFMKFNITSPSEKKFTVFVGALHGRMHAKAIAHIFNDVFGDVTSVSIDTDEHDYPTGSGRVTFGNINSFKKAILANFIQIESKKVSKRIQIEPCIDGQSCCWCSEENVPNFCKEPECFDYYCNPCWLKRHKPAKGKQLPHSPIRRKSKNI